MVDAPVGYQCPDCASPKKSNVVNVARQGTLASIPVITRWIILVCIGVFFVGSVTGGSVLGASNFGMFPPAIAQGQWYRLLTAAFLHAGLLHIAFNLYALYIIGPGLEMYFGHRRYATIYFLAAIGASVASYAFSSVAILSVGASGAIFGIMTATLVVGRAIRADTSQIAALLLVNLLIGAVAHGIDWRAHLGGAAFGAFLAFVMTRADQQRKPAIEWAGIAISVVVMVALTMERTQQIHQLILG